VSVIKIMLGVAGGIFLVIFLVCGGCVFLFDRGIKNLGNDMGSPPTSREQPTRSDRPTSAPSPRVTKAKYDAVQEGMSYAEVVRIIGFSGVEQSSSKIDGAPGVMPSISTKMYSWQNPFGSNMNAIFQNDRLVSKAQFGLE